MAGTFHDSALGSSSGSATCSTSDALTVTAGDLVWVHVKWESTSVTITQVDTGASTPTFTVANATFGTSFKSATYYWIATSTTTVTPRVVFSGSSDFNTIRAISVTPAGGTSLVLVDTAAAEGNGTTPSSGAATAGAAGASFAGIGIFASVTYTEGSGWTEPAEFEASAAAHAAYQMQTGGGSITANGTISGANDWIALADVFDEEATATLVQEGFRWGVDDDTEAAHTFEAAQDTDIEIAADQSRLLRILIDSPNDPASLAYTLRYQKNGSGGYVAVPVGATTDVVPTPTSADVTEGGSNTASTSWAVAHPNASTGDLLLFFLAWDDSTTTTDVAEPAGPNSEVLSEINATPSTNDGTTVRCKGWYTIATGSWTAGNLTFTPTASEQRQAIVVRIPAGQFDATTPLGTVAVTDSGASTTDMTVQSSALNAGATDGPGRLFMFCAVDVDPVTATPSGWTEIAGGAGVDVGAVAGGVWTRDAVVTDSESVSAQTTGWSIGSSSWASVTFVLRGTVTSNEVYVATSANITAGGEATTARLTAPAGKTTSDFTTGRRWDNENGSDAIDIADNFYTEVEWLVYIAASAAAEDFFDFRVYAETSALNTYSVTPRWAIPSEGGGGTVIPAAWMYYSRLRH